MCGLNMGGGGGDVRGAVRLPQVVESDVVSEHGAGCLRLWSAVVIAGRCGGL